MTFTTLTFVLFLILVFSLYWACRHRTVQNAVLVIASYGFYGWWDFRFCALLLFSSMVDYAVGLGLDRARGAGRRRALLLLSLTTNLGLLGFFKYFNFFTENFEALAQSLGWSVSPVTLHILLPVGISFYTFQTLSYTIDIYQRRLKATSQLVEYLAYVSFFPQLVAGPIERGTHLLPQFLEPRSFNLENAKDGCRQMLWGLFKKMAIADNLGAIVNGAYAAPEALHGPGLLVATLCFAFQIYCDFSAYSDIACGTARLFGFSLMRNFAHPYFSQSLGEFWRRWHISLSTWFRQYVYIPLGGNRSPTHRRVINILITFVLSGVWHGASWNFVLWGAIHGAALLPEALNPHRRTGHPSEVPGGESNRPGAGVLGRMLLTFAVVNLGWIFFRAQSLSDAGLILQRIFSEGLSLNHWMALGLGGFDRSDGRVFVLVLVLLATEWFRRRDPHPLVFRTWTRGRRWLVYTLLIWATLYLGTFTQASFIYFQF